MTFYWRVKERNQKMAI